MIASIISILIEISSPCKSGDIQYIVDVEEGVFEPFFEIEVSLILNAKDGWGQAGHGRFCQGNRPNFAVLLATPETTDEMCHPMRTMGRVSCSRNGRAVINLTRWRNAAASWDLLGYHRYIINHEVGHILKMPHGRCSKDGETPVMKQQSNSKIKCPRGNKPIKDEIQSLSKKYWLIYHLRKNIIENPWERPEAT